MKKINTLYVRRLTFTVILSILGIINVFAQRSGGNAESDTSVQGKIAKFETDLSVIENNFNGEISTIKNDIKDLKEMFQKTTIEANESFKGFLKNNSKMQFFQIISAVSLALIAVLMLGAFVVFLLKNIFHIIPDKPGAKTDKTPEAESKNAISELFTDINSLKYKLENIQSELKHFLDGVNSETLSFKNNLSSIQTEIAENKQKSKNMEAAISSLEIDIDKVKEKYTMKEEVERDPVAVFNKWAQNPVLSLPHYFTYVTITKPETRTKLDFTDSVLETDWIRNTVGEKKCLFPNPKKIDNLSGPVDDLYKVIGTRKSLGANSVKITNVCQLKDGDYIEYKGELALM